MERKIKRYFDGVPAKDGAGVKLYRTFGYDDIPDFDPFSMMDFLTPLIQMIILKDFHGIPIGE